MEYQWYVIHTYAGYENKVKADLERRIESMNMEGSIFRIVVPMEDEIQVKEDGKRKIVSKKVFPGYVLVEMDLNDSSWYVVRNTPGVTGFVGTGNKPVPLSESEVEDILRLMGEGETKYKINFEIHDEVRVKAGAFEGMVGIIEEISTEKGKLKVLINMFGRDTQIEIDYNQVEKK